MDHTEHTENAALRNVVGDFISSYAQRDTTVSFSSWLSGRLCQELSDLTPEASAKLTAEIMAAVAGYDRTLQDLNSAIDAGCSKEEWLSEQLESVYQDMPIEEAGKTLQQMEASLDSSNVQLMSTIDPTAVEGQVSAEVESVEWNRYSVKAMANNIGRQANMLTLSAAANAMTRKFQDGEAGGISAVINDALQGGLQSEPEEVKAVVSGAVRAAAERGLTDMLPQDTSVEVIGGFAGAAVEGAMALCDAANGTISMTEAMDRTGRAGVAAGCRIGAELLRGRVASIPVVGPIFVDLLGGLFDHLESSTFVNDVYTAVRNTAVATWNGVKESRVGKVVQNTWAAAKRVLS